MSTTWPTPLMLPGQAAAPPGPCDLTGMYVMHHAFRRDLARFATATRFTPAPDRATWSALARWWERFATFLHEHHTKEDEGLWPALLERVDAAGDRESRQVLEAMEAEHDRLDPVLAEVATGLRTMSAGPGVSVEARDALADAVRRAADVLEEHLAHEERAAVAIVQHYLDADQWAELEATHLAQKPGPRDLLFFLPWIADELPEATLGHLLGSGPAPVRALLGGLLRLGGRGYRRARERAFHAVPR